MRLDAAQLDRLASETGFQVEPLEKVIRLLDLLDALRSHPYLGERLVLKGGTALNVFVLELPRLSVDIDLNYVGRADREGMLEERPQIEDAVRAVCDRQGATVRRAPSDHAGGKWRLSYDRAAGGTGSIELDLNFLLRVPLWTPARMNSPSLLGIEARQIAVLDLHELAGGKLAALFGRSASRDLYDASRILELPGIDRTRLRLAFVVYGAMNRRDWRTVSLDEIRMDPTDAERMLVPMVRGDLAPDHHRLELWCAELEARCRDLVSALLPFRPNESEFLEQINDAGNVRPELLTDDSEMQSRIARHPALQWKALNVRQHRGGVGS